MIIIKDGPAFTFFVKEVNNKGFRYQSNHNVLGPTTEVKYEFSLECSLALGSSQRCYGDRRRSTDERHNVIVQYEIQSSESVKHDFSNL